MDTAQSKMFVRSLNNSAAKILIAFILARSALDVQELRDWTGMKRETIYDALRSLKELGKVDSQVLAHNRTVWLPSGDLLPGFRQLSEKGTSALQLSGFRTTVLGGGGGDSINLIKLDSPLPPQSQLSKKGTSALSQEKEGVPSAIEILRHTDLLFDGSVVATKDLDACAPMDVLAWCAYAYSNKRKLNAPAGLVRRRLADGDHPPGSMQLRWQEILPADFLEALDLITYVCEECQATFKKLAEFEAHELSHPPVEDTPVITVSVETVDESVTVPIHGNLNAERAWEKVLGQLQMEMPRASFDSWVKHSRAVRFHGNVLSIGVNNGDARDWLESRLASTVERLLVGILARSVSVEFVVAQLEIDDE